MIVLFVFTHAESVGSDLTGYLGWPLMEEGMIMPMAVRVLGFPQFTLMSWGLPNALSSKGKYSFCPQNLAQSPQKVLKYLPWKLNINVNKCLTMVLCIC